MNRPEGQPRNPARSRTLPLALAALACGTPPPSPPPDSPTLADHHVHLLSPALVADWKSLGVPFSRPDSVYTGAAALFEAGLGRAALVSMGHLYADAEFRSALGLDPAEERSRVARENDYVAAEALRYAGRAVAVCSVPALRPYAEEELRRCRALPGVGGIKVHLASAGADLTEAATLTRLGRLAGWLDSAGVPLLLHFDPQRRGLDTGHVRRFIEAVLEPHPGLEVVVAHLGGSGGYGPWTRAVAGVFADWLAAQPDGSRPGVRFDLSAVVLERESEGVPATTAEEAAALAEGLRRLGLERVVFGSDYPVFDPFRYAELLRERVPLRPEEWHRVLGNRAPVLEARQVRQRP